MNQQNYQQLFATSTKSKSKSLQFKVLEHTTSGIPQKYPNQKAQDFKKGLIQILNTCSQHQAIGQVSSAQKPKKSTLLTEKQSSSNIQKTPSTDLKQRTNSEKRKSSIYYNEPRHSIGKKVKVQGAQIQLCNEGSYSQKKRNSQNSHIHNKFLQTSISSRNSIYHQNQDTDTKSGTRNSCKKNTSQQNSNGKKQNMQRYDNIKHIVKKQQQKSLSRDFTKATTLHPTNKRLSLNTQQFSLFKSQNEFHQQPFQTNQTTVSSSQSPNNKYSVFLTKKKLTQKAKNVNSNAGKPVVQYKPPLKKNLIHLLNQQVLQQKHHTQMHSSVGSKKNSVSYTVSRKGSACSAYSNDNQKRMSKENIYDKSRLSESQLSVRQDVDMSTKRVTPPTMLNNFIVQQDDKENLDQVLTINDLENSQDLSQVNKNFTKLIEQVELNSEYQLQVDPFMSGRSAKVFKAQLEKVRQSYEKIIKGLQEKQQRSKIIHSERFNLVQNNVIQNQRIFSEKQIINEEDVTTYATTSPHQDLLSSQSSFRNSQIPQAQFIKKIFDLEQENKRLKEQIQQKDDIVKHQEKIIEFLKIEPEKQEIGLQTYQKELQISESRAEILVEGEQLKRKIKKLEKRVDYHKNKENKFLFFLFTLQNKGIPVNEIYEEDGIRDIPTSRFAEIMQQQNEEAQQQTNLSSLMFSFYSDDSYEPIQINPVFAKKNGKQSKPRAIPSLNLANLPEYETSSDEDDNEAPPKTPPNAYEQSMKYIENFYNKCAMIEGRPTSPPKGEDEEYALCQPNNDSSIVQMQADKPEKVEQPPVTASLLDDEFCYSIEKSRCRSSFKDNKSV